MTAAPLPAVPPGPALPPEASVLPEPPVPPAVDHPRVAAVLAGLADLDARPLAEHEERLRRAAEELHEVLQAGSEDPPPTR